MSRLRGLRQKGTTNAEQSAAAFHELSRQADGLQGLFGRFTLIKENSTPVNQLAIDRETC